MLVCLIPTLRESAVYTSIFPVYTGFSQCIPTNTICFQRLWFVLLANVVFSMNGNKWYSLEAFRATNQAIGRVIRHSRYISPPPPPGILSPVPCDQELE